jgi:3-methyladenine DNA glycosylase AlkD
MQEMVIGKIERGTIMWYENMFLELEQHGDETQGSKMSAYMQNNFPFLGIPKPELKQIIKQHLKNEPHKPDIDWKFVRTCWEKDYREAQYIAIEYLNRKKKKFIEKDIDELKYLITNKSWWETIDSIDVFVGILALQYPKVKEEMLRWSLSDNIWLRRVAIDYQQEYNDLTDTKQLETIICNNLGTDEFFINKAIGWSLRDYSKTNPEWVRNFIDSYRNKLAKLSIKEAEKYL